MKTVTYLAQDENKKIHVITFKPECKSTHNPLNDKNRQRDLHGCFIEKNEGAENYWIGDSINVVFAKLGANQTFHTKAKLTVVAKRIGDWVQNGRTGKYENSKESKNFFTILDKIQKDWIKGKR